MADDSGANSENIGAIDVSIGADYSSLQSAWQTAQDLAETAGEDIASAFNDGVASVADGAEAIGEALSGVSDSADEATTSIEAEGNAAETAGEQSEEAASKLQEMAEQMLAIGEALVITEGLKEFGDEALSAADSIKTASIALTTMTGSAEQADTTIEGLEQLGMADGLAMPSLLTAAQRMTALLPPGTDVVGLLGNIADGAAAMGTSVDQAANRFDQITNAGTLSARALTSMGLSLSSVAQAMNELDPSADATTATVTAMFKAMDPGDRITVLQTALQGLGGTAEQVANQTFGGQWQQLANAWEKIMEEAGQAILPVVSGLTDLAKTEVLPFIEELVSDFNALPTPLKDAAVGVGLVVAAAIPLSAVLAAASLGFAGLNQLVPNFNALMQTLGVTTATTASAQTTQALATAAQGEAAAAATPEIAAEAAATEAAGVAASEAAVQYDLFAASAIEANWGAEAEQLSLFADAEVAAGEGATAASGAIGLGAGAGLVGSVAALGLALVTLPDYLKSAESAFGDLKTGIAEIIDSLNLFGDATKTTSTWTGLLSDAWQGLKTAIEGTSFLGLAIGEVKLLGSGVQDLAKWLGLVPPTMGPVIDSLNALQASATATAAGEEAIAASFVQSQDAAEKLSGKLDDLEQKDTTVADSMASIDTATSNTINGMGQLASSSDIAAAASDAQGTHLATLSNALITAQQKLVNTDTAVKEMTNDVNAGITPLSDLVTMQNNLQKAADAVTKAQTAYDTATVQAATDAVNMGNAIQDNALKAMQDLAASLPPGIAQMIGLDDAMGKLQADMPGFGVSVTALSTGPLAGLQSAYQEASDKVAGFAAQMAAGMNVGQQYEKALTQQLNAQIALNVANAESATGLQGMSDALSLATLAVVAAQAKFDTLNQAYQTNVTLAPQVAAAQTALTNAQHNLTTAQNAGATAANAVASGTTNMGNAANAAVTPMGSLNTAMGSLDETMGTVVGSLGNVAAGLADVGAAVESVVNDIGTAVGQANVGKGITGGGAGWTVKQTGIGDFGQPIESATYTPNLTQEQFDALVDHYGLAFAQNVEKNYNAIGYSDNYSPTVVTSTSSTAASGASGTVSSSGTVSQSPIITSGTVTLPGSTTSTTGSTATTPTETLAQAQAGVTAAQNAIVAAMESASTTAAQMAELQVVLAQAQDTLQAIEQGNTSTTASTSSTTPITTSSNGSGTGAVDGGSYPAVTAHQAAGEIWAVSGTASAGGTVATGSTSSVTENITSTIASTGSDQTQALGQVVSAIGGAVEQLAIFTGDFLPATQNLANIASAVGELVKTAASSTGPVNLIPGGSNSATGSGSGSTSGGSAVGTGPISTTPAGGGYAGATGATQSAPINNVPGYNPFGPTGVTTPSSGSTASNNVQAQVSVDMRGSNFGGTTQAQMVSVISAAVTQSMVDSLRAAGARF